MHVDSRVSEGKYMGQKRWKHWEIDIGKTCSVNSPVRVLEIPLPFSDMGFNNLTLALTDCLFRQGDGGQVLKRVTLITILCVYRHINW